MKRLPVVQQTPWQRQPGETPKSFEAFVLYLDLGMDRSLSKVATILGKLPQQMGKWSACNNWVERSRAWDNTQEDQKRQAELSEVEKMGKRHASQAQALLQTLMVPVTAALKKLQADPALGDMSEVQLKELLSHIRGSAAFIPNLMRVERLARGEPTDIQGGQPAVVVQVFNAALIDLVELFKTVNTIEDPERRKREFALGADKIVEASFRGMQDQSNA